MGQTWLQAHRTKTQSPVRVNASLPYLRYKQHRRSGSKALPVSYLQETTQDRPDIHSNGGPEDKPESRSLDTARSGTALRYQIDYASFMGFFAPVFI